MHARTKDKAWIFLSAAQEQAEDVSQESGLLLQALLPPWGRKTWSVNKAEGNERQQKPSSGWK